MTNSKTTNESAKKDCKACLHYESCKGTYASAKGGESLWHDFDAEMYAYCGCEDFQHKDLVKRTKYESKKYRNIYQAVKEEVTRLHDEVRCQKAEIERLKKRNTLLLKNKCKDINTARKIIKSEAIKEFAERLKEKADDYVLAEGEFKTMIFADDINNLVKEMMGDRHE